LLLRGSAAADDDDDDDVCPPPNVDLADAGRESDSVMVINQSIGWSISWNLGIDKNKE